MDNYFCNSKRPHTVIKNLIYDLKKVETGGYNSFLFILKRLVKDVNYFKLSEIDFALLRFFILYKLSNDNTFNIDNATYYHIITADIQWVNSIITLHNETVKKNQILNFLNHLSYRKEEAIRLQNMETKKNEDLLFILNYCEI